MQKNKMLTTASLVTETVVDDNLYNQCINIISVYIQDNIGDHAKGVLIDFREDNNAIHTLVLSEKLVDSFWNLSDDCNKRILSKFDEYVIFVGREYNFKDVVYELVNNSDFSDTHPKYFVDTKKMQIIFPEIKVIFSVKVFYPMSVEEYKRINEKYLLFSWKAIDEPYFRDFHDYSSEPAAESFGGLIEKLFKNKEV